MNIIIAGSRTFNDYELLKKEVCTFIEELNTKDIIIVCGMANGADKLGYKYAKEHNLNIIEMLADWNLYGKSAGYKRNLAMSQLSEAAIIFTNGSKGSQHMIDIMRKLNKPYKVILF